MKITKKKNGLIRLSAENPGELTNWLKGVVDEEEKSDRAMEYNKFEMPTPCQHCGDIFDLNNGRCSDKWYKNTTICESCWKKEQEEIEEDERWEIANYEVVNALFIFRDEHAWEKLTNENKTLIMELVNENFEYIRSEAKMMSICNDFVNDQLELDEQYKEIYMKGVEFALSKVNTR